MTIAEKDELRLQRILECSRIGTWEWNVQSGETVFNEIWAQIVGYTLAELSPVSIKTWETLAHPGDLEESRALLERHFAGELPYYDFECRMKHKDGRWVWVHDRGKVVSWSDDGKPLLMLGTHEDISDGRGKYQMLFNTMSQGVVYQNASGEIISANPAAERILGLSLDQLQGRTSIDPRWKASHEDGSDFPGETHPAMMALKTGKEVRNVIMGVYHPETDSNVWIKIDAVPLFRQGAGKPYQAYATFEEITKRKQAEDLLQEREEDLKESQRIAHVGSWRLNISDNQVAWSEELYKMYGFDPSLPPPPFNEHRKIFTPESWDRLSKALPETIETRIPYELELETVRPDGSRGWMWVRGEAVLDTKGSTVGLRGAAQDITERKQVEDEIRAKDLLFRKLSANVPDLIYQFTRKPDGTYFVPIASEGIKNIFGCTPEDVANDFGPIARVIYPDDAAGVFRDIEYSAEHLTYFTCEFRVRIPGKETQWLYSRSMPEKLEDGSITWYGFLADITERKAAEAENAKLEAQLQQAQKMESVGRLAGGVAHDFNNMLGVILGHIELVKDQSDMARPISGHLEEIEKAARRSADLTRQLLAFARKQTVAPKVLDLSQTVEGMLLMLGRLIGEDIDLDWKPNVELWPVNVDPSQIDQILVNLCVNARDAIGDVGKITIETGNSTFDRDYCALHPGYIEGEYVQVIVSDNGCGMDRETQSHLFEPFFTTKGVGKGTGLGLATVYGIVKQNNGFINVYSEPGNGTTFKVYLPRHSDEPVHTVSVTADAVVRGSEVILLVEDEPAILNMIKMMLEKRGYTVFAAATPSDAIRLAAEHTNEINLLITDVVMPEMNGRDLAKNLLRICPRMKRLFMSGYTSNVIAHHGVLDKGVHFIEKPFTRASLDAKVREALDD